MHPTETDPIRPAVAERLLDLSAVAQRLAEVIEAEGGDLLLRRSGRCPGAGCRSGVTFGAVNEKPWRATFSRRGFDVCRASSAADRAACPQLRIESCRKSLSFKGLPPPDTARRGGDFAENCARIRIC